MHSHMAANQGELMDKVNASGDWNDELETAFHRALKAFKDTGTGKSEIGNAETAKAFFAPLCELRVPELNR